MLSNVVETITPHFITVNTPDACVCVRCDSGHYPRDKMRTQVKYSQNAFIMLWFGNLIKICAEYCVDVTKHYFHANLYWKRSIQNGIALKTVFSISLQHILLWNMWLIIVYKNAAFFLAKFKIFCDIFHLEINIFEIEWLFPKPNFIQTCMCIVCMCLGDKQEICFVAFRDLVALKYIYMFDFAHMLNLFEL